MQTLSLPEFPAAFAGAGWPDVAPYFEDLASAPLSNDNVEDWLKRWSQLEELIDEAGTLAMVAYTGDTADADKEKAHLRFSTEIFPQAHEQSVRLSKRLLERTLLTIASIIAAEIAKRGSRNVLDVGVSSRTGHVVHRG